MHPKIDTFPSSFQATECSVIRLREISWCQMKTSPMGWLGRCQILVNPQQQYVVVYAASWCSCLVSTKSPAAGGSNETTPMSQFMSFNSQPLLKNTLPAGKKEKLCCHKILTLPMKLFNKNCVGVNRKLHPSDQCLRENFDCISNDGTSRRRLSCWKYHENWSFLSQEFWNHLPFANADQCPKLFNLQLKSHFLFIEGNKMLKVTQWRVTQEARAFDWAAESRTWVKRTL